MEPPPVQYATTSDGVSIAWNEIGEGPALLRYAQVPFCHVQEVFALWERAFQILSLSFRVVNFDARGTGMSERDVAAVSTETLLLDAEAVIDAAELDHFVALASSNLLAASTCLRIATAFPERVTHLVLETPYQNMRELADTPFGRTNRALAELDWSVYTQTLFRVLLGWDGDARGTAAYAAAAGRWVDPSVGVQYVRLWETVDLGDLLTQVRQPTLVLRNDPNAVPARLVQRVAAKIPRAQFRQHSDPTFVQQRELLRAFVGEPEPPPITIAPAASSLRTVLFTDMESSTALTQRLGDASAQELLRAHNTIVRDALNSCGGAEIKHTGDGIMASFPSASRALECAIAIQRAVTAQDEALLRVRIGLNAGEPVAEEHDLFGTAVQLARRVCDHADAGQILVSDVVRQLAAGKNFLFSDVGDVVPKGFDDAVRLYEVRWREEA